jgi:PadR family transcriptional regulator AphA
VKADPDAGLLPGEWAVLGLLCQSPAHGFAVARRLAAGGDLGMVWTMGRPRVYRAISDLANRGFIEPIGEAASERGPTRVVYAATASGRAAFRRWLETPVDHVRDVRSDLLLKLALIDAANGSPRALLEAQRVRLVPVLERLEETEARAGAAGFERTLLRYRVASARGVLAFIDDVLTHEV